VAAILFIFCFFKAIAAIVVETINKAPKTPTKINAIVIFFSSEDILLESVSSSIMKSPDLSTSFLISQTELFKPLKSAIVTLESFGTCTYSF
jgi:hypothetical protein